MIKTMPSQFAMPGSYSMNPNYIPTDFNSNLFDGMEDYMLSSPKKMESFISSGDTLCDVIKAGLLKKVRTNKKKYFVLRRGSAQGNARLEYYDSEKRFSKPGAAPKRIVKLKDVWNIAHRKDGKKACIVVHTKEESLQLVAEECEHDSWVSELRDLHETEMVRYPGTKYDNMWSVSIKPTGLGAEKCYVGKYRMCLSSSHLSLIRLDMDVPDIAFPLNTIRRCGHNESHFVMSVGRSAPTGEGDMAFQVEDALTSQEMHGLILAAMKANKSTESSSGQSRARSRSHQYKKSSAPYKSIPGQVDLQPYKSIPGLPGVAGIPGVPGIPGVGIPGDMQPMSRPRTMSECTTKPSSYGSPARRSPKTLDRRTMSAVGRCSVIGSSTTSSPFSSCSSIEHQFRIRSDSSGSRQTATSDEDAHSRNSSHDEVDYLDMTCGASNDPVTDEETYLALETGSRHSSQSLEAVTEDSGYMEMTSGGSTTSSKQDGASSSRRPSLISPPDDDYLIYSPLDQSDHATSPSMTSSSTDDQSEYVIHSPSMTSQNMTSPCIRVPPPSGNGDYIAMGPCHSLPTVQERSGDSRVLVEPNASQLRLGVVFPSAEDVPSPLNQPQPDFPKRAYSVGSRPELKPRLVRTLDANKNDARSSSAPHLEKRLVSPAGSRGSPRGSPGHSPVAPSPASLSRRSSRDDPELFMEVEFDRPRLASESIRPRTSSWGAAHRPRCHSHASKLKRGEKRATPDLSRRQIHGPGSSESLTKIHYVSPHNHDYMEISPLAADTDTRADELASSVKEMTLQYTEIMGPVGIVTRTSGARGTTLPRTRAHHVTSHSHVTSRPPRPIKTEDTDTYVIGEPLNVREGDDVIPRMVDVWTPGIRPGDEDEDEYMCLNQDK